MIEDVTFCSVSFFSKDYLRLNQEITGVKNWYVLPDDGDYNIPGFKVPLQDLQDITIAKLSHNVDFNALVGKASYRHADKLNQLTQFCKTRFIAYVDPDFFIFEPIENIIKHMKEEGLHFFGAPYYPDPRRKKVYDFPVGFCMFVDTEKVDKSILDFTPAGELPDGTMGDTGYHIYKNNLDKPNYAVLPSYPNQVGWARTTQKSLSNTGIQPDTRMDEYFYPDGKLFGVHLHAKLHLRQGIERQVRAAEHITAIKKLYKRIRANDKSV